MSRLPSFTASRYVVRHGTKRVAKVALIGASALRAAMLIQDAVLKVYPGAPHGLAATHGETLSADPLAFLEA